VDRAQGWHIGFPEPELPMADPLGETGGRSLTLTRRPRS
jgi:hypothetical protein